LNYDPSQAGIASLPRSEKEMKYIAILITLVTSAFLQAERAPKEFTSKQLNIHFQSKEEAKEWSLIDLSFDEWVDAVSEPSWTELHKSQTKDFYFAMFRSEQCLIFCVNDRNGAYFGNVYSIDGGNHDQSWAVPIVVPTVQWELTYPHGKVEGQKIFATWKILEEYRGNLTIKFSSRHTQGKGKNEFKQTIKWN